MTRNIEIKIRLSKDELQKLNRNVKRSGMSREGYLRELIRGYEPQALPPIEYYDVLRELREIQDSIENLGRSVHSSGMLDSNEYSIHSRRLGEICNNLQTAFVPRKQK